MILGSLLFRVDNLRLFPVWKPTINCTFKWYWNKPSIKSMIS